MLLVVRFDAGVVCCLVLLSLVFSRFVVGAAACGFVVADSVCRCPLRWLVPVASVVVV